MIRREEFYARRCVEDLVLVIEQVPLRAAVRAPMVLDHVSIRWVALWTLLRWERTFLLVGLEQRGVDVGALSRELDELLKKKRAADAALVGQSDASGRWATSPPSHVDHLLFPLLDQAAAESRALGHYYVGTEHLLLALIAWADEDLSALLERHSMTYQSVREMVGQLVPSSLGEVALEVVRQRPFPLRAGGPTGAGWDSEAAGVPRRFGMAIVLLIMTMYAVLFAAMKLLNAPPEVFAVIAVLFTGVGLGQMLLFRGRYPRAASVWVGACLFPVEILVVFIRLIYLAESSGEAMDIIGGMFCFLIFSIPLGAGLGYLAGGLTAGVFFLLERYPRRRQPQAEVDVLAIDEPAAAGPPQETADREPA